MTDYRDRCIALSGIMREHQFLSRRSAAALWRIPVDPPPGLQLEVGAVHPKHPPHRPEVLGHRVRRDRIRFRRVEGLRVPSAADTWCLLAAVLSLEELVIAGDSILTGRRRRYGGRDAPLATPGELAECVARHVGGDGIRQCREALPLLRFPVDSPPETLLRRAIIGAGFDEPVVSYPVPVAGRVLHADLGYPELKIAIEYEGAYHFDDGPEQARRDAERWEEMSEAGWRVLRVQARTMRDLRRFFERLRKAIVEARRRQMRRQQA